MFDAKIQTLYTRRCQGGKCHHHRRKSAVRCHRELLRLTTAGVYTGMCCAVVAEVAGKTEARFKPHIKICRACQKCSRERGAKGGESAPEKKENTSPPWANGEAGVLGAGKRDESVAKTPRHCGIAISTKCSSIATTILVDVVRTCRNRRVVVSSGDSSWSSRIRHASNFKNTSRSKCAVPNFQGSYGQGNKEQSEQTNAEQSGRKRVWFGFVQSTKPTSFWIFFFCL